MKDEILRTLRRAEDYVSGQELCERLGVSRTSVWKHIRALQAEGYEIEAVKNRGYRLSGIPDTVAAEEVASRLSTARMGRDICYFSRIDSTNRYARQIAEEGAKDGTLIIADEQTDGRGRQGRSWITPPGEAIAFSLLLRPELSPDRISMVTLVMGLAVVRAINGLYDAGAGIKWPNDAVLNGKKVCGILTEMSAEVGLVHHIVIGVGINANLTVFPKELQEIATSLKIELGREINRAELIARAMEEFEKLYAQFERDGDLRGMVQEYNARCLNTDRAVRVLDPQGEYTGTGLGIDEEGRLQVALNTGEVARVYAGEVSVRGLYSYA